MADMEARQVTTIPRRQLGRQLRLLRQESGLSIEHAARLIKKGATTIQRLEKGEQQNVKAADIEALCGLYEADAQIERLKALAEEANSSGHGQLHRYQDATADDFGLYLTFEACASSLAVYQPYLCPGLVQTANYARALHELDWADRAPVDIERAVALRTNRQKILRRRQMSVAVHIVLEESVLHRVVGGPKTMAEQLRHIVDLPGNVVVQVIPLGATSPFGGNAGAFVLLDFDDASEPPTVYVEELEASLYYERHPVVERYRSAHERLRDVALSQADSKRLIRYKIKEYSG